MSITEDILTVLRLRFYKTFARFGALFADKSAQKFLLPGKPASYGRFGAKLYKTTRGFIGFAGIARPEAVLLFREQRNFKGYFSFFVIKKRNAPLTPKRKNILKIWVTTFLCGHKAKAGL